MKTEFEVCGMKFLRCNLADLKTGNPMVSFVEDSGTKDPFQVRITKAGMKFKGEMTGEIYSENDVQDLAQFMSVWVEELRRMRPKISTSFSGH